MDYLYCGKKKSNPRLHYKICETKCPFSKNCVYFKVFKNTNPEVYPLQEVQIKKSIRKRVKRKSN